MNSSFMQILCDQQINAIRYKCYSFNIRSILIMGVKKDKKSHCFSRFSYDINIDRAKAKLKSDFSLELSAKQKGRKRNTRNE